MHDGVAPIAVAEQKRPLDTEKSQAAVGLAGLGSLAVRIQAQSSEETHVEINRFSSDERSRSGGCRRCLVSMRHDV